MNGIFPGLEPFAKDCDDKREEKRKQAREAYEALAEKEEEK